MRSEVRAVLTWAGFLAVLSALLGVLDGYGLPLLMIGLATAATIALAGWLQVRRQRADDERALPDQSYATLALALGIAGTIAGVAWGIWLTYMALLLVALGLGGLVRERRAERGGR